MEIFFKPYSPLLFAVSKSDIFHTLNRSPNICLCTKSHKTRGKSYNREYYLGGPFIRYPWKIENWQLLQKKQFFAFYDFSHEWLIKSNLKKMIELRKILILNWQLHFFKWIINKTIISNCYKKPENIFGKCVECLLILKQRRKR